MRWEIQLNLANGTTITALLFADGGIFADEPIAKEFTDYNEFIAAYPGTTYNIIGPSTVEVA